MTTPETQEPTEAMVARVRESLDRQGLTGTLGVELIAVERGRVELALRHDERFTQQHGFMHAGAVAAVLDSACGYAAYSVMPPEASVLTVTYTIRPAGDQRLRRPDRRTAVATRTPARSRAAGSSRMVSDRN
jgi:acyl-coenzyme A thioesterase PaaI-like protein